MSAKAVNIDASFNGVLEPNTTYYLTCDLTLSKGFTCSRRESSDVYFYGNGYIISVVDPPTWDGLFNCDANVFDLGITALDNSIINRSRYNSSAFFSRYNNGYATNCYNFMSMGGDGGGFFSAGFGIPGGAAVNCYNAATVRNTNVGGGIGGYANNARIYNSYNSGGWTLAPHKKDSDYENSGSSNGWNDALAMKYLKGAPTQCPGQGKIWTSVTKGEPWILTTRARRLTFPLPPAPPTTKIPIPRPPLPSLPASTFAGVEAINKEGGVDISFNYNASLSYTVDVYTYKRFYYTPSYFDANYKLVQSQLVTNDPKYIKVYGEIEQIDESPIVIRNLPAGEQYYFVLYAKNATNEIYHPSTITSSTTETMLNKMEPSQFLSGVSLRYIAGLGILLTSGSGSIDAYTGTVRDMTSGMKTLFVSIIGGGGGEGGRTSNTVYVARPPGLAGGGNFIYSGAVFSEVTLHYTVGRVGANGLYVSSPATRDEPYGAKTIYDGEDGTSSEISLYDRFGTGIRAGGGGGGWSAGNPNQLPSNGSVITSNDNTFLEIPFSANIWPPVPKRLAGIRGDIFIASSTLYISTFVGSKTLNILAGQTVIVTLFAQAYKSGVEARPIYPGSAIMFLCKYAANGTLKLTDKDSASNCSATMVDNNGNAQLVQVQQNKTNSFSPPVIVDQSGAIKTIWTTIPNNKWYEVIGWNLVNNPDNNKSGYWECSVWDRSILGNDPPM